MDKQLSFQNILWAIFAFIGAMLLVRFNFTGTFGFIFLIWNLFLAWIPYTISTQFGYLVNKNKWVQVIVFITWLLLFPNAFYIVTDLIHLNQKTSVPKWYDAVLLFASSITGIIMAFVSLFNVEKYLLHKFSSKTIHLLVAAIIFSGSFGVYLGRFLRWNSWDVISNPIQLLYSIGQRIIYPLQHLQTWGVTVLLATLFYLLFLAIKKMPGFLNQAIQ